MIALSTEDEIDLFWVKNKLVIDKVLEDTSLDSGTLYYWTRDSIAFIFEVDEGFFILRPKINLKEEKTIECLIAYGKGDTDLEEKYRPFILDKAREIGAVNLLFYTKREGWFRKAKKAGYKLKECIFEMEV